MGFAGAGVAEALQQAMHGKAGCHLPPLMSAYTVRQHEQLAVRTCLRWIGGSHVPVRVLVPLPDLANVGLFAKIQIQHGSLSGPLSRSQGYVTSWQSLRCTLNHNTSLMGDGRMLKTLLRDQSSGGAPRYRSVLPENM